MRTLNLSALIIAASVFATSSTAHAASISKEEASAIGRDAYVYAYPLVLMDITRQQLTNFVEPSKAPGAGPANRFIHIREFPDPKFKAVIRPNADTLYSSAWLDLKAEPVVLTVPATDRYFLLPMLSMWTDVFAVPGTRTTGSNTARTFLVTGPGWSGTIPAAMEQIKSPTRYVWFIGRTQTNGPSDYAAVHKLQEAYKLTLLSGWGKKDYVPPAGTVDPKIDMTTAPPEQVDKLDMAAFFARFAQALRDSPPNQADYPTVHRLERVGIKVGEDFDLNAQPSDIKDAVERGAAEGKALIAKAAGKSAGAAGGWAYQTAGGAYGVDYLFRAAIAKFGLGYNLPQDAVYPSLSTDSDGQPLDGAHRYVVHFEKGKLPPVHAFWSLTAYDKDGYFIENSLGRSALGDRSALVANADGSVDLYLQATSPGKDKEANWLPVAGGEPFNLLLRLYWPSDEVIDGSWTPPPVKKVQ